MTMISRLIAVLGLAALPTMAAAQEITDFANLTGDGAGFTVDFEALAADERLSDAEKAWILAILEEAPGYVPPAAANLMGVTANCGIRKKLHVIPDTSYCDIGLTPGATDLVVDMPAMTAVRTICDPVSFVSLGLLKKICFTTLMKPYQATLEPVLRTCSSKNKASTVELTVKLATAKPGVRAFCK